MVATGTASGKTESFLYPILFELYQQHLAGMLDEPGVRALVLYPMNALANDQRERLGEICRQLQRAGSDFLPTFGQYIGETPNHGPPSGAGDGEAAPGELLNRRQMRETPPHILLTNYSMLEYLLLRPDDSPLFDDGRARHWKYLVLDEAHQYRGAKGMEMGMLLRRLKQRLRHGGRECGFRCIATSATMSSGEGEEDRNAVAGFAEALFGEPFSVPGVIFGEPDVVTEEGAGRPAIHPCRSRSLCAGSAVSTTSGRKRAVGSSRESGIRARSRSVWTISCRRRETGRRIRCAAAAARCQRRKWPANAMRACA